MDIPKALLAKEKAGLSADEVFGSAEYRNMLMSMLETTARLAGYKRSKKLSLKIYSDESDDCVAYTNGETVYLNIGCRFGARLKKSFKLYHLFLVGLVAHELGHILWTDFQMSDEATEQLKNGYIPYAEAVEEFENYEQYDEMLADSKIAKTYIISYFHALHNIVEDIFVNAKQSSEFKGNFRKGIALGNALVYEESQSIADMTEAGMSKAIIFSNALIQKLKTKSVFYGSVEAEEEYEDTVDMLVSEISALIYGTPEMRIQACNIIICELWEYIENDINELTDKYKNNSSDSSDSSGADGSTNSFDDESDSDDGTGNSSNSSDVTDDSDNGTGYPSDDSDSDEGNSEDDTDNSSNGSSVEEEIEKIMNGLIGQTEETQGTEQIAAPSAKQKNSGSNNVDGEMDEGLHELLRKVLQSQDCDCDTSQSNTVDYEDYSVEDRDFDSLVNGIAKEKAVETAENAVEEQLNDDINGEYGIADYSGGAVIKRFRSIPSNSEKVYNFIAQKVAPIANAMCKEIESVIKEENLSECRKNRIIGKKLTTSKLYKPDFKVWEDRKNPKKVVDLAISVRVDESGSMCGDRIYTAQMSCILLKMVADKLNIPIEIIGDTEDCQVELYPYCTFDSVDGKDKYRLATMESRCCNRDGYAIRYCYRRLKKRKEKNKLLIIISDGMPSGDNYYGEAANNDLRILTRQIKRDNIAVIAFGFGSDSASLKSIYGNSFLCYENLDRIPKAFAKMLKEQILRKL